MAATGAMASSMACIAVRGGREGRSEGTRSRRISDPTATTKQATRGGVLKDRGAADTSTLHIANPISPLNPPAKQVYSTLVREKPGYLEPSKSELVPDIAESWETSPDGLTVT